MGRAKTSLLRALQGVVRAAGTVRFEGRDISAASSAERVRAGPGAGAGGATDFRVDDGAREPAAGRASAARCRDLAPDIDGDLRSLPQSRPPPGQSGAGAVGRRAADAGDRPCAAGAAAADDARRAFARAFAAAGGPVVRSDRRRSTAMGWRCCSSSRTRCLRWTSPRVAMCWNSAASACRATPPMLAADPALAAAYLGAHAGPSQ